MASKRNGLVRFPGAGWLLVLSLPLLPQIGHSSNPPPCASAPVATLPDLQLSRPGTINVIAIQDDGQILIGGSFTSVNNFPVRNLARINHEGAVDSVWTPNPDGPVYALATSGTNLFVGGAFEFIGGQFRFGIALLSTSEAVFVDPVWAPEPDNPAVYALAISGTNLFVGGDFTGIGYNNISFGSLGKLSTTGVGEEDPNWFASPNAVVNTLLLSGSNLYVGGDFTIMNGYGMKRLARLSTAGAGSLDLSWNPNVDGANSTVSPSSMVSTLALSGTNLFVSGSYSSIGGIARANLAKITTTSPATVDAAWNPAPVSLTGNFALALNGTDLFVGGRLSQIGGQTVSNLARVSLSGSGSAPAGWAPSVNAPVTALLTQGTWLLAGGSFSLVSNTVALSLAKLDQGTGILDDAFVSQVATPGAVYAMARQADGKIIVGGDFWLSGQVLRPHLARINADGTLDTAWATATDGPVNALAISGTNVFVGGNFHNIGGQARNCLAKVDISGTDLVDPSWNLLTSATVGVYALAADSNNVYIGGNSLRISGQPPLSLTRAGIADPAAADSSWYITASGTVYAIALSQTNLFAGGDFTTFGGTIRSALVKLITTTNGVPDANWNLNINSGGLSAVYALSIGSTNLFLGGSFSDVGGLPRPGLAKATTTDPALIDSSWDAATNSLISPVLQPYALALSGTNLYVSGWFAGSRVNLARVAVSGTGLADTNWHPNPYMAGFPAVLQGAMLTNGHNLYVGGFFQTIGGSSPGAADSSIRNGFAYLATGDAPVLIKSSATNLVVLPNPGDGPEVTWFQITGITGTLLYLSDGITPVNVGDFITVAQGAAGLLCSASNGVITAVASLTNTPCGAGTTSTTLSLASNQPPVFSFSSASYSTTEDAGQVVVTVLKQGTGAASVSYSTANGSATGAGPATVAVPNSLATVEGNSGNVYPFSIGAGTMRYQQVYAASQFGSLPAGGALITAIAFRPDGSWGGFTNTLPSVQINLATTTNGPDGLNSVFANNVGSDNTVVFSNALPISSAAVGNPRAFDIVIPLTTPFLYNPGAGNLLLDVRNFGGGTTVSFDAVSTAADSVSRLYDYSSSSTTGAADTLGLITQFAYVPASPTGDYTNASGTLSFSAGQTSTNIIIGIRNDALFEGNETFTINLRNPTAGATIGYPGTATITILESDLIGSVASQTATAMPSALTNATGALTVVIPAPPTNGQWRLTGGGAWLNSGASVSNLVTGNYGIEFMPVSGYQRPDSIVAAIAAGSSFIVSNAYLPQVIAGYTPGWISWLICPEEVANNLTNDLRGQWLVEGWSGWLNSGDAVPNLPPGEYRIDFKPNVGNYTTPQQVCAHVFSNEGTRSVGIYSLTSEDSGFTPTPVPFSSASSLSPYVFMGQLVTDLGFGSGVVVNDRVVLTAAKLLFNDDTLTYVTRARWFFQRYSGSYEPKAQLARGWQIFSGYSTDRNADTDPCMEGGQSQNLDMAAVYFAGSAGRGGYSGYLVSDASTNWLMTGNQKLLAGYAMEAVALTNQGKLLATTQANLSFTLLSSNTPSLFTTTNISAYPGLAGGPLFVQGNNGNYYPAGVYLGPSQSSAIVRVLDASAAELINRAVLSATVMLSVPLPYAGIHSKILTTNDNPVTVGGPPADNAYLMVATGPQAALGNPAGGGWTIKELSNMSPLTGLSNRVPITGASTVTVAFNCADKNPTQLFAVPYQPPNLTIQTIANGQTYIVYLPYLPAPTNPYKLTIASPQGVTLSGAPMHYRFQIEYTDSFAPVSWTPLPNGLVVTPDNNPLFIRDPNPSPTNRFYRAHWITCPQ